MYNRYIPQQDGTHKRNRVEEPPRPASKPQPSAPDASCGGTNPGQTPPPPMNIGGFLKNLIPRDFDTGDLIVVLLLLLMAGDKPEDKNTALLTLALYCFL